MLITAHRVHVLGQELCDNSPLQNRAFFLIYIILQIAIVSTELNALFWSAKGSSSAL